MSLFKGKLGGFFKGAKKFENKDFLKATAGVCVAVGFADGSFDDMEQVTMTVLMKEDENLSAFTEFEIDEAIQSHVKKFQMNTMIASMGVEKVVKALGGQEQKEMVVALGVAIAGADGNIDKEEIAVIKKYASTMGVNASKFGI